uniref:Uncharacterized protein n=1 Tax=Anguilla anguilla TaxID=7936 RepID=A0A0E9WS39_ANGAN
MKQIGNYTSLVQKSTQVLRITCSPENLLNKIFSEETVSVFTEHQTSVFYTSYKL